jgi:hypothetical protein
MTTCAGFPFRGRGDAPGEHECFPCQGQTLGVIGTEGVLSCILKIQETKARERGMKESDRKREQTENNHSFVDLNSLSATS